MGVKRARPYIVFAGIILYIIFYQYLGNSLNYFGATSNNDKPYIIFFLLGTIILGALLGLNSFLDKLGSGGKLTVKWCQLLAIGLPALIFILIPVTSIFVQNEFLINLLSWQFMGLPIINSTLLIFMLILLGFVIISSFNKAEIAQEDLNPDTAPINDEDIMKELTGSEDNSNSTDNSDNSDNTDNSDNFDINDNSDNTGIEDNTEINDAEEENSVETSKEEEKPE